MTLGTTPLGTTPLGTIGLDEVVDAIEVSSEIPPDAKKAVVEFIKDTFKEAWDTLDDLLKLQPPTELADYWDIVITIVQGLIG